MHPRKHSNPPAGPLNHDTPSLPILGQRKSSAIDAAAFILSSVHVLRFVISHPRFPSFFSFFPLPSPLYFYERAYRGITQREFNRKEKKKRKIKKKSSSTATDIFFFPLFFSFLSMQSGIVPRLVAIKMFMRSVKGSPLLEGKTRRIWTERRTREKAKSVEISVKIGN